MILNYIFVLFYFHNFCMYIEQFEHLSYQANYLSILCELKVTMLLL